MAAGSVFGIFRVVKVFTSSIIALRFFFNSLSNTFEGCSGSSSLAFHIIYATCLPLKSEKWNEWLIGGLVNLSNNFSPNPDLVWDSYNVLTLIKASSDWSRMVGLFLPFKKPYSNSTLARKPSNITIPNTQSSINFSNLFK